MIKLGIHKARKKVSKKERKDERNKDEKSLNFENPWEWTDTPVMTLTAFYSALHVRD